MQWSAGPLRRCPFFGARQGHYPHLPDPIADTAKVTEILKLLVNLYFYISNISHLITWQLLLHDYTKR